MSTSTNEKRTLVVVLAETRAHELTFNTFKQYLLDEVNADLCVCIGAQADFNFDNPFYNI